MKEVIKMVGILIVLSTVFIAILLAYRNGYKDARREQQMLKECISEKNEQLSAYRDYYSATEKFLDQLDSQYNWIDAFDPQAYYESRHIIMTLEGTSLDNYK